MPTYLCHGFRWPRPLIRIHIILQNLDDAAAEWLMAPATRQTLLANFKTLYPAILPSLPNLNFIEQYDPKDLRAESKSQPHAYVCDVVEEVKLGLDVDEVRGKGVRNEQWSALVELRDKIAPGEKVAWFVVVCGDTDRWAPPTVGLLENGMMEGQGKGSLGSQSGNSNGSGSAGSEGNKSREEDVHGPIPTAIESEQMLIPNQERPKTSGFKKWFGKKDKSTKSPPESTRSGPSPPPALHTQPLTSVPAGTATRFPRIREFVQKHGGIFSSCEAFVAALDGFLMRDVSFFLICELRIVWSDRSIGFDDSH
ncbi:hypothetical protein K402DRAFT_408621 [Aulographum hederae CBS 113979]|uniref:Developmental regulator protein n=1 Tax=Aulographum hederae CBS 113979 TaxID=1176131 RepID=A0A6G1GKB0_9PEZI|nr:hypothetical protein K402DRAFT_408621 [Aulographum hederae CBS 113979]